MSNNTLWRELRQTFLRNDRMVHQLIIVNVSLFLLLNIARLIFYLANQPLSPEFFATWLAVPTNFSTLATHPWTLITSLFTHIDFGHILFNMLFLYWFGKILAEFLGNRKILPLYLMGGLSGTLLFILAYHTLPVFQSLVSSSIAWGASASVLAIVAAAATLVPDYSLYLIFFGPVKIKWIAPGGRSGLPNKHSHRQSRGKHSPSWWCTFRIHLYKAIAGRS
jgi:membrane associated rhomboid family serine protease